MNYYDIYMHVYATILYHPFRLKDMNIDQTYEKT